MSVAKRTGVGLKGFEWDALTRFRKFINWRPGERKSAKVSFNRRVRHQPVELDEGDLD